MSFEQVGKIGRPGPATKKAEGIYKISANFDNLNLVSLHEIVSTIAFGDPFIQVGSGSSYTVKLAGIYRHKATVTSGQPVTLQVRLGDSQAGGFLYNKTVSHSDGSICQDTPTLVIAPNFILNSSSLASDKRFRCDFRVGGGTGRTICLRDFTFELLFILNSGSITTTRGGSSWNGRTVTVEQL